MGYRSIVAIAIEKEEYAKHILLLDKFPSLLRDQNDPGKPCGSAIYWYFESIKWYDSFPEIVEVNSFISELDDDKYGFIRIGEDDGDIDSSGEPYEFDMYIQKSIDLPIDY